MDNPGSPGMQMQPETWLLMDMQALLTSMEGLSMDTEGRSMNTEGI